MKKYIVQLDAHERKRLEELVHTGKRARPLAGSKQACSITKLLKSHPAV